LKLETVEEKHTKLTEISELQEQLRVALERQKQKAGEVVDEVVGKVGEYAEETKEAGRAVVESVREGKEEVVKTTGAVGKVAGGGWWPW
jgi:galactokinase/mevalonate kinase-like predicted kinase